MFVLTREYLPTTNSSHWELIRKQDGLERGRKRQKTSQSHKIWQDLTRSDKMSLKWFTMIHWGEAHATLAQLLVLMEIPGELGSIITNRVVAISCNECPTEELRMKCGCVGNTGFNTVPWPILALSRYVGIDSIAYRALRVHLWHCL